MSLTVVGSIALDSVETPKSKVENALGGSSTFITLASSYFTGPVNLVGVVGDDFPEEHIDMLKKHNVQMQGLQVIKDGKTFRWSGKYHEDFNDRDTIFTELNVFQDFDPVIPQELRDSKYVVLGNIDPALQLKVLEQMNNPEYVVCDTMNLWINIKRDELLEVIKKVDVLIINDSEAKMLSDESNVIKAAKDIMKEGPETLIIKKGEHGALLFSEGKVFSAPAYPMSDLYDPTGAGDTFLGGFTGYLHKTGNRSFDSLKKAVIYGSAMASFCVEDFSTKALEGLDEEKIKNRYREFYDLSRFDSDE